MRINEMIWSEDRIEHILLYNTENGDTNDKAKIT